MAAFFPRRVFNWTGKTIPALLISLLSLPANSTDSAPLAPVSAVYSLSGGGFPFTIRAERTVERHDNGDWEMVIRAGNLLGEVRETSRFRWQEDCLPRSHYYGYLRRGLGMRREAHVRISPDDGQARIKRHDRDETTLEITPTTTDQLAQGLALQCMVARGDTEMELDVINERRLETMKYRALPHERVPTRMGRMDAIPVERVRDDDSERSTTMWFAPEMDHALVRMVQDDDGDRFELQIRERK